MSSEDIHETTEPARSPRPPQGTPAELEDTQRWWLRTVYGPTMALLGLAALVTAVLGTGDRGWSAILFGLIAASAAGAWAGFRTQLRTTGRLALDERDETRTMRTAGYAWCFSFLGVLAWAVAWAATTDGQDVPVPFLVLGGLGAAIGLGRLCTRREGF